MTGLLCVLETLCAQLTPCWWHRRVYSWHPKWRYSVCSAYIAACIWVCINE